MQWPLSAYLNVQEAVLPDWRGLGKRKGWWWHSKHQSVPCFMCHQLCKSKTQTHQQNIFLFVNKIQFLLPFCTTAACRYFSGSSQIFHYYIKVLLRVLCSCCMTFNVDFCWNSCLSINKVAFNSGILLRSFSSLGWPGRLLGTQVTLMYLLIRSYLEQWTKFPDFGWF